MSADWTPSRERLQRLLVHRAERKSGTTPTPTQHDSVSRATTDSIRRHVPAAKLVERLANDLRQARQSATPDPCAAAPRPTASSFAEVSPQVNRKVNHAPTPHLPVVMEEPQPDLWATIAKQAAEEQKALNAKERAAKAKKLEQQKAYLDDQVSLRRSRKAKLVQELRDERTVTEKVADEFLAEKRRHSERCREVAVKIKTEREEQVAKRQEAKERERVEKEKQEREILERIEREVAMEARRVAATKEREKRFKEDLITANEAQKRLKAKKQLEEANLEAEYVRLQDERLAKQANARQEAWDAVKQKMKGREAIAFNLQATLDDKAAEDDRRAQIVVEERIQAQKQREEDERRKRAETNRLTLMCQVEQIRERNAHNEAERARLEEEKREVARQVERDQEAARAEKEAARRKRELAKSTLTAQITTHQKQQTVLMSDEEKRLNNGILKRAASQSPDRDMA